MTRSGGKLEAICVNVGSTVAAKAGADAPGGGISLCFCRRGRATTAQKAATLNTPAAASATLNAPATTTSPKTTQSHDLTLSPAASATLNTPAATKKIKAQAGGRN